jgi:hypothetical protein
MPTTAEELGSIAICRTGAKAWIESIPLLERIRSRAQEPA